MIEQRKSFSDLAVRLRVLKLSEKKSYLTELDRYVWDRHIKKQYLQPADPFFPHRLASQIYCSLEGEPYTQPKSLSQMTKKDITAHKKFNALFAGVITYAKATNLEKENFKKSVLKNACPLSKIGYLLKMHQNGMV